MKNIGLIAVILIASIVLFTGCLEEETPTKVEELTPTPEATPEEELVTELNLKIGETAQTSKMEVTVISAEKTKYYVYYSDIFEETMTKEASPGKRFILTEIEIKNI